jgi:cytochrome oxidase Cu insertion factor (SCO1/SenC/PrrC family)
MKRLSVGSNATAAALALSLSLMTHAARAHDEHAQHAGHDHHAMQQAMQKDSQWNDKWETARVAVPDVSVLDQNGRKLRFHADLIKGRTVAVDFIYTACSTVCSPLTATLRQVQKELAKQGKDVQLISVSVDPETDTPAVLREYASRFEAAPGWTFVTGKQADIDRILKAFGVAIERKEEHTPIVFIGNDGAGRWTRAYGLAPAASITKSVIEVQGLTTIGAR